MLHYTTAPNLARDRMRIDGKREAIFDYDNQRHYTYNELYARSDRLASFLLHQLDMKKGDRIAFCATNSVAHIDAFYASLKTGYIITTYNHMLSVNELSQFLMKETPKVLFYTSGVSKLMAKIKVKHDLAIQYISLDSTPMDGEEYCYNDIMAFEAKPIPEEMTPDFEDTQMLIHTGGTTGLPKAAVISYRSLFFNTVGAVFSFGLSMLDSTHVMLPLFHTAAWNVLTLPVLHIGGRLIITSGCYAETSLKIIAEEKPTVLMSVETLYLNIAEHPNFAGTDFSSLRFLISGAAPISQKLMNIYWKRGIKLVNGYGMTEIGPTNIATPVNSMSIEEIKAKGATAGKPLFFNNVRIVDEDGQDVPDGEDGELIFQGELSFSGYWMDQKSADEISKDGWIYSGDIGCRDSEGFYYIRGRKKNMFISGGENIYPIEIEQVLINLDSVLDACVIGIPDTRWGEVGKALVVKRPDVDIDEDSLMQALSKQLSKVKRPKCIQFVDNIPKNSIGKLDFKQIYAQYGVKSSN
ncbi:AMP-binding protein [Lachnospiraceae bacterium ZAX-1]